MTNLGGTGVSENTDFDDEITALFDRQDRLNPLTLAAWQADPRAQLDDAVTTAERESGKGGGAVHDVITGTGAANGVNIVANNANTLSLVLRIKYNTPVEAFGLFADDTDMSAVLTIVEALKTILIFTNTDGKYRFDSVTETTKPHIILMKSAEVTLNINNTDGLFNINFAPFEFSGGRIEHLSRVLFFGNDNAKYFDRISLKDLSFQRDDSVQGARAPIYFPNTHCSNVIIENVFGQDAENPANHMDIPFINIAFGSNPIRSKNWEVRNVHSTGYSEVFLSSGTTFGDYLTVDNVTSTDALQSGFTNYHWGRSNIRGLKLIRNAEPAYVWCGNGEAFQVSALESIGDGVRFEQMQCDVEFFGEDCGGDGCRIEWGSNHAKMKASGKDCGGFLVKVAPGTNTAVSSEIDDITIEVDYRGVGGVVKFDQEGNTNHPIKHVTVIPRHQGSSGSGNSIEGRGLLTGFVLDVNGGFLAGNFRPFDIRSVSAATDSFDMYVNGTKLSGTATTGDGLVITSQLSGRALLQSCFIDDTAKLTGWAAGPNNDINNCWDETTHANVSG